MKVACVFDLEGVIIPPGIDFAKIIANYVARCRETAKNEVESWVKHFDMYDDARWIFENIRSNIKKYQTGTTPLYTLLLASSLREAENLIDNLAEKVFEKCIRNDLIVDISELRHYCEIYIASSAYHRFVLKFADYLSVTENNVYALGHIPDEGVLREKLIKKFQECASMSELWNVAQNLSSVCRFAISEPITYSKFKCVDMFLLSIRNEKLSNLLVERFVQQVGVCGSKAKARIISKLKERGYFTIFVGDSIVDVEAAHIANISISVNTTCTYLLHASTFNLVLEDYSKLVKVLEVLIQEGADKVVKLCGDGYRIFTGCEVMSNYAYVTRLNEEARKKVAQRVKEMLNFD